MDIKRAYPIQLKASDPEKGTAVFIASVFGRGPEDADSDGDVVLKGAFADTLERRRPKFVLDHEWSVANKLGKVLSARETDEGLEVEAQFNLEKQVARETYSDMLLDPEGMEFSFGFSVPSGGATYKDGVRYLKKVDLYEVSAVLLGANERTRLVSVKEADPTMEEKQAVDNSEWDGNAAMAACETAADYRAICAGERTVGEPDERQHWALPHHKRPGAPPNAAGVRNALARLPQTRDLANPEGARRHLEAHMRVINPEAAAHEPPEERKEDPEPDPVATAKREQYRSRVAEAVASVVDLLRRL